MRREKRKCDRLAKKTGETYRIVQDGEYLLVVSNRVYNKNYKEYCENKNYMMRLVYTREPQKELTLEEAKKEADEQAKLGIGGHVVEISYSVLFRKYMKYAVVSDNYLERNKAKVLYSGKED